MKKQRKEKSKRRIHRVRIEVVGGGPMLIVLGSFITEFCRRVGDALRFL